MTDAPLPNVNVNLIRIFEGPRHDRLRLLWDCYAELRRRRLRLFWYPGAGRRHAQNLKLLWAEEMKRPERYAIITEHDFLPNFNFFTPTAVLGRASPVVAVRYVTRNPETLRLVKHDFPGAWYLLIDKEFLPEPNFDEGGPCNDPANLLATKGVEPIYLEPIDCYPRHYGVEYMSGSHLFWSRHLHDDPSKRIAGCCLGDIQAGHDRAVDEWIAESPASFRRILARRERTEEVLQEAGEAPKEAPRT